MHSESTEYQTRRTKNGYRLIQHGVVLSEMRSSPGATDSVFDVLAALVSALRPEGRLGLLGFASGAMVAPLRSLGVRCELEACDLDPSGFELFNRHCSDWSGAIDWAKDEASQWLRRRPGKFDMLIDDLSVPVDGDVFKPECSWSTLPRLMRTKLKSNGVVVANQLRPAERSWRECMTVFDEAFGEILVLHFDEFENRIVVAGGDLPTAAGLSRMVRDRLVSLDSRQTGKVRVRRWRE